MTYLIYYAKWVLTAGRRSPSPGGAFEVWGQRTVGPVGEERVLRSLIVLAAQKSLIIKFKL